MADCEQCAALRAEVSELNSTFDARWSADMRAIECWRKVNPGNELVLPDHVDLSLWLMEERTRLIAEVAKMKHMVIAQEKLLRSKDAENEQNKIDLEEYRRDVEKLRAALEPLACTCDRSNGAACSRSEVDCPFWNARAALEEK